MTVTKMRAQPLSDVMWGLDSIYAVGYGGGRRIGDASVDTPGRPSGRDIGCEIAPHCLECPLPRCRYDLPPKRAGALLREAQVRELLAAGNTADECALAMHVSRRTVFRLKRYAVTASILPLFGT